MVIMENIFRINKPKVVYEIFADEVVVVNLESGNYYSLNQVAAGIWQLIEQDASLAEIVAYFGPGKEVNNSIARFIAELHKEELIMPNEQAPSVASPDRPAPPGKMVFAAPTMQKYIDMQELLLLDPIHDVDAAGWPSVKIANR